MVTEVPRLLHPAGKLLVSFLIWNRDDPLAAQNDELIARHNPAAAKGTRHPREEIVPAWSSSRFRQKTYHQFAPDPPFTRASWRGRINASKWIGAGLPAEQARAFDREDKALLEHVPRRGFPSATASPFTFLSPAELGSSSSREPDIVKMDPSAVVVFTTYP